MSTVHFNKKDLFTLLVTQLKTGAWSQLGKTPNPLTGKPEPNLQAAAVSIGILEDLLFKTAGRLSKNEDKLLSDAVRELKLSLQEESDRKPG